MCGPQTDADNHELCGFDGRDADYHDEFSVVDVRLGHSGAVHLHEISFLRFRSFERAVAPHAREEVANAPTDAGPERFRVRLEYNPLQAAIDGSFDENKKPA